ncbi:nitrate- and nitrite sensing domain-containing protein [Methylobacillus arboreus]|uniref:nitrate regulatory protein n=1 Tax=Methylobacillus arboreus TaxID=755170 RepID=UPI001E541D4F|nr:nitrate regulatory protein [Methylobacillus arboreus]MCB5191095.1 nitrate- and nitrite sensing domain-containing protein [Methylobacillus arboreus]
MKSGLSFLVAARQGEIVELEQLARSSELTNLLGQLIHKLQRERGASNVFLASGGVQFAEQRQQIMASSDVAIAHARDFFDRLDPQASFAGISRARLFSRIAYALHGLDALPGLRQRIAQQAIAAMDVVNAYVKLITSLLAVVFEAADSATDPDISRLLVAYFNFMQGKELAGQERAIGAVILGYGRSNAEQQQQLLNLIDGQERCLQTFRSFADQDTLSFWSTQESGPLTAELERLRRMVCTTHLAAKPQAPAPMDDLSVTWYDCCTRRIDGMRQIEDRLAEQLQTLCREKILRAKSELQAYNEILQTLSSQKATAEAEHANATHSTFSFFDDHQPRPPGEVTGSMAASYGPQMERAILEMMQEQAQRLQTMSDELNKAKAALHERKYVERAKGLLMTHRQLSEEAAYKMMRQMAMEQNRHLVDVAKSVLALESYLNTPAA